MSSRVQTRIVEQTLGFRVVLFGTIDSSLVAGPGRPGRPGYQMQGIDEHGKTTWVRPASENEFKMFSLLCLPQERWHEIIRSIRRSE